MNPPFTRDSLRHDQFSRADELAIKQREKAMLEKQPYREAARLSGSANAFMVLADDMSRDDSGTVAVVLPTAMATNPAASETRKYLANRFHIDTVVAPHDPQRIFFSENTSIGEVLLVCRRWNGDAPKPPTRVVNLARNPETPLEALDTATRIDRLTKASDRVSHDLTIQWVEANRIALGDWYAVNFLSPFLVDAYRTLTEANPGTVPAVPLSHLAEIGPAGKRVRDSYHLLGSAYGVGPPRTLFSQDGDHAVHARRDRRVHRTERPRSVTWPTAIGSSAATCCCRIGFD